MTKRIRRVTLLALLAFAGFVASAAAATYTVGSVNDTTPGTACTPSSGTCSLRELIEFENGLAASTPGDTIHAPSNFYTLTNGQLTVTHSLTLNGDGPRTTEIFQQTASPTSRVFDLQVCPPSNVGCPPTTPLPVVNISGIGVFFGKADSSNGFVGGNIRNQDSLTLTDDVVADGGTTNGSGAGISNDGGVLTVVRALIETNGGTTTNDSGGIQNFGPGPTTGAAGQLTVSNSTIVNNTSAQGGGIMSWCGGSAGACSTDGSSLSTTIANSTIVGNDGGNRVTTGGGVLASQGTTTLLNTIVANNTVDNPVAGTPNNCGVNAGAAITSLGHNLAFPGTDCPLTATGDLQNTDPHFLSSGLEDLGGLTDVIALDATSPAVDAIPASAAGCNSVDQRLISRPQGRGCDIGAFEVFQAVEGLSFTTLLGTVGAQSGTTPTIDWGDGTAASTSSYDTSTGHVTGTHTYAEEGTYTGTINYLNSDGSPSSTPFSLKVQDAPLGGSPASITAVAGAPFNGAVATFTDADPAGTVSDYMATIDWGDGTSPSPGTISAGSGDFIVSGTHTYSTPGPYTVTVSITDQGGASATARGTVTVVPLPTVTSVSPGSGPAAGGTSVTITGTGFTGATAVNFGGVGATTFSVDSDTQITATSPSGTGTVDVTVTTPAGTSATGSPDQFTYSAPPAPDASITASGGDSFSGVAPTTLSATVATFTDPDKSAVPGEYSATIDWGDGSSSAGTITGSAGSFTVAGTHTYSAAGSFAITVTIADVDNPANTATATDQATVTGTGPAVTAHSPVVTGSTGAAFSGSVNPEGDATKAHFEYGLDARYRISGSGIIYDQFTTPQQIGSDFTSHNVSATVSGLIPNALYHVRLVASNPAGTVDGPDQTFMTSQDPAPPPPTLGKTFNAVPVSGLVFVKPPKGKSLHALDPHASIPLVKGVGFIPLTEARQLPSGSEVDARRGTMKLISATGHSGKTQTGTFSTGLFKLGQDRRGLLKGLTTLTLVEGAFSGAPSYSVCKAHAAADSTNPTAQTARLSSRILQTLHASDNHGRFRTRGRYSAATVRGTKWDTIDRCDGTLTIVHRGTVVVSDFRRHKTITLHAGHSYLAAALRRRHG